MALIDLEGQIRATVVMHPDTFPLRDSMFEDSLFQLGGIAERPDLINIFLILHRDVRRSRKNYFASKSVMFRPCLESGKGQKDQQEGKKKGLDPFEPHRGRPSS